MKLKDMKFKLCWAHINWPLLQKVVTKLQRQIYKATLEGNSKKLRAYQTALMKSPSAQLIAIRKVSQDNRGKVTAGVDGVRNLKPEERLRLRQELTFNGKADAIRRVYIPKPGTGEKRPLGIPTLRDRAKQALGKLVLEPEWEARFEPNSYGFRPGRSCHDAIQAIWHSLRAEKAGKFVLDADISKCFDRINHEALLAKLNTWPRMHAQVRAWLKTGVLENGITTETTLGTPQGGVISPLLSNIALHGLENHMKTWIGKQTIVNSKGEKLNTMKKRAGLTVVRYADDFVILHKDETVITKAKTEVESWLKHVGLELKEAKTRVAHTDSCYENENPGFDFLGFHVRRYYVGSRSRNKWGSEYKTFIKPAKKSVKNHLIALDAVLKNTSKTEIVTSKLNPIIRGWCNYFSTVSSKLTFARLRLLLWSKLWRWVRRKHPQKSRGWLYNKYFKVGPGGQKVFGLEDPNKGWIGLKYHNTYAICRHVKVQGTKTPYDGDHVYWSKRLKSYSALGTKAKKLLKMQAGRCALCKVPFEVDSLMEVDHIEPKAQGGSNHLSNLRLVHGHCHDQRSGLETKHTRL